MSSNLKIRFVGNQKNHSHWETERNWPHKRTKNDCERSCKNSSKKWNRFWKKATLPSSCRVWALMTLALIFSYLTQWYPNILSVKSQAVFLSKNIYISAWAWTALKFNNSQWSRFGWDVPLPCAVLSIDGYEGRCPTSVCVCVLEGGGRKRETVKERAG